MHRSSKINELYVGFIEKGQGGKEKEGQEDWPEVSWYKVCTLKP